MGYLGKGPGRIRLIHQAGGGLSHPFREPTPGQAQSSPSASAQHADAHGPLLARTALWARSGSGVGRPEDHHKRETRGGAAGVAKVVLWLRQTTVGSVNLQAPQWVIWGAPGRLLRPGLRRAPLLIPCCVTGAQGFKADQCRNEYFTNPLNITNWRDHVFNEVSTPDQAVHVWARAWLWGRFVLRPFVLTAAMLGPHPRTLSPCPRYPIEPSGCFRMTRSGLPESKRCCCGTCVVSTGAPLVAYR